MKISLNVSRWPLWVVVIFVSVMPIGMLLLDYYTCTDFDFLVLYLIPVLMVTWRWGSQPGYIFAMGGVVLHAIADRLSQPVYTYPIFFYWNLLEYFIVLNLFVIILTRLKTALRQFREANDQLADANRRLQEALRLENEFLRMAAHDLKNPLVGVLGFSDLLVRTDMAQKPADVIESAQFINAAAHRMVNLIGNLLDVSKYESGQFKPELVELDLAVVTRRLVAQNDKRAALKKIPLHNGIECATPAWADLTLTEQVMDNLLSNAIKFSAPGQSIFVRSRKQDDQVLWEVQDQGPGLSAKDKTKLFQKFARLSAQPTGGENSTGLGLSIVKMLVEAMGGRVWCESELGRGATFIVAFPTSKPAGSVQPVPAGTT